MNAGMAMVYVGCLRKHTPLQVATSQQGEQDGFHQGNCVRLLEPMGDDRLRARFYNGVFVFP